jgi:ParB family chromosome partitioning protein
MQAVELPTTHIFARKDARKVDDATVAGLIASIREIGIINPLRVRKQGEGANGIDGDAYEVTAGAHRLRAARKLGLETVPCVIVEDDDLRAELAMIDENLCRAELGEAERTLQTKRRKQIYILLHPETEHGGNQGPCGQFGHTDTPSFVEETAAASGRAERSIRRDAERGAKISDEALRLVAGTALNTGSFLDKLKRVSESNQVSHVERALADMPAKKPARALSDAEAVEKQFQAIVSAWNRAGTEAREQFKAEYIDTPVMDRRFG